MNMKISSKYNFFKSFKLYLKVKKYLTNIVEINHNKLNRWELKNIFENSFLYQKYEKSS